MLPNVAELDGDSVIVVVRAVGDDVIEGWKDKDGAGEMVGASVISGALP